MKICHISDVHFCDKYLDEVNRVAAFATQYLHELENRPELIVLSGDLFDHRLEQNSPAYLAAIRWVCDLGNLAPVFILQGTYSHDAPHALDVFRHIDSAYRVYVSDRIEQVTLEPNDGDPIFNTWSCSIPALAHDMIAISSLPAVNKGVVAAAVGAENAGAAVGEAVAQLLTGWAESHRQARAGGIPTIVVSHGTVSGSYTEHGVPMAGLDHEYTVGTLFAAEASAVMLGHIHRHQAWEKDGRRIAYPGSLGRLHFGEEGDKGFLMWEVSAHEARAEFVPVPARKLLEVEYAGTPDMEQLAQLAAEVNGTKNLRVRVRYAVDVEHKDSVDRGAIERLFAFADLKIEGRIIPVERQRSAGIGGAISIEDKLKMWGAVTGTDVDPLIERLHRLHETYSHGEACSDAA